MVHQLILISNLAILLDLSIYFLYKLIYFDAAVRLIFYFLIDYRRLVSLLRMVDCFLTSSFHHSRHTWCYNNLQIFKRIGDARALIFRKENLIVIIELFLISILEIKFLIFTFSFSQLKRFKQILSHRKLQTTHFQKYFSKRNQQTSLMITQPQSQAILLRRLYLANSIYHSISDKLMIQCIVYSIPMELKELKIYSNYLVTSFAT